jgi:hypothetical protein
VRPLENRAGLRQASGQQGSYGIGSGDVDVVAVDCGFPTLNGANLINMHAKGWDQFVTIQRG